MRGNDGKVAEHDVAESPAMITKIRTGLILATALAAMASTPATATPRTAILPKDLRAMIRMGGTDLAVGCAAYLSHYASQVPASRRPRVVALSRGWMARVRRALGEDGAAQYNASTFAVLNDNSPAQIARASARCSSHYSR